MTGGYVVVVFGGPADGWCDLNRCPMYAVGPFDTSEQAHAACEGFPEWQMPHVLRVKSPDRSDDAGLASRSGPVVNRSDKG